MFTSDSEVNEVAERFPVEGRNFSVVEETSVLFADPVVTSTNIGYLVEDPVVLSVTDRLPPPIYPHAVVYPSNCPRSLLYLKSPAVGEEFLCAVVPTGTLIDPVPPISTPSAVVSSLTSAIFPLAPSTINVPFV